MQNTIVSFKQNTRIIRQRTNSFQKWDSKEGKIKIDKQKNLSNKRNFNVRQTLHEATFYGKLNEKEVSTRYGNELESLSVVAKDKIMGVIESIVDKGIQKILINHLKKYDSNPELAFSFDGIKEMNKNVKVLNEGNDHKPIYKVSMKTALGNKFSVAESGMKSKKYVTTAPGSNVICGIYQNKEGERKFEVPTLRDTIENLKQGFSPCKEFIIDKKTKEEYKLLLTLSPNDLVYVPDEDNSVSDDNGKIYKFTDASGDTLNFIPYYIATPLVNLKKEEYEKLKISKLKFIEQQKKGVKYKDLINEIGLGSPQSKHQNSFEGEQIKKKCIKLKVDRLGNIIEIHGKK